MYFPPSVEYLAIWRNLRAQPDSIQASCCTDVSVKHQEPIYQCQLSSVLSAEPLAVVRYIVVPTI